MATLALWASTASAQEPIALPLSVHVEHSESGPVAQSAYADYAVELANRWLRPMGVCVFPASRHVLEQRSGHTGDAVARRHVGRSIPVVLVDTIRRPDANDGSAGWGRSGQRPLVLVSTQAGRPFTLAHELGHVLGERHQDDEHDIMHRSSPGNYAHLNAPPVSRQRARRMQRAARSLQRRLGVHPAAHCAVPRALAHPNTIGSGHPVLVHARVRLDNGTYEGERFFGRFHGEGTWRGDTGYQHRGEYRLGSRHGWGEERHANGSRYVGAFADGDRHGFGAFHYASGSVYRGDYRSNDRHGHGVMVWADGGTYVGQYRDDAPNGRGRKTWPNGAMYDGDWVDGEEHGQGRRRYSDGDVYEGPFRRGVAHGHGRYRFASGAHYRGAFEGGRRHGFGRFNGSDGTVYEGDYRRGQRHGSGTIRWTDGRVERRRYVRGTWQRGRS